MLSNLLLLVPLMGGHVVVKEISDHFSNYHHATSVTAKTSAGRYITQLLDVVMNIEVDDAIDERVEETTAITNRLLEFKLH
jgi:hypothetical protein